MVRLDLEFLSVEELTEVFYGFDDRQQFFLARRIVLFSSIHTPAKERDG